MVAAIADNFKRIRLFAPARKVWYFVAWDEFYFAFQCSCFMRTCVVRYSWPSIANAHFQDWERESVVRKTGLRGRVWGNRVSVVSNPSAVRMVATVQPTMFNVHAPRMNSNPNSEMEYYCKFGVGDLNCKYGVRNVFCWCTFLFFFCLYFLSDRSQVLRAIMRKCRQILLRQKNGWA